MNPKLLASLIPPPPFEGLNAAVDALRKKQPDDAPLWMRHDLFSKRQHGAVVPCLMCEKQFILQRIQRMEHDDWVCDECLAEFRDFATVVCIRCGIAVAKLSYGRKHNGWTVEKKQKLHIRECAGCNPDVTCTPIEEYVRYEREHGRGVIISQAGIAPGKTLPKGIKRGKR